MGLHEHIFCIVLRLNISLAWVADQGKASFIWDTHGVGWDSDVLIQRCFSAIYERDPSVLYITM